MKIQQTTMTTEEFELIIELNVKNLAARKAMLSAFAGMRVRIADLESQDEIHWKSRRLLVRKVQWHEEQMRKLVKDGPAILKEIRDEVAEMLDSQPGPMG